MSSNMNRESAIAIEALLLSNIVQLEIDCSNKDERSKYIFLRHLKPLWFFWLFLPQKHEDLQIFSFKWRIWWRRVWNKLFRSVCECWEKPYFSLAKWKSARFQLRQRLDIFEIWCKIEAWIRFIWKFVIRTVHCVGVCFIMIMISLRRCSILMPCTTLLK